MGDLLRCSGARLGLTVRGSLACFLLRNLCAVSDILICDMLLDMIAWVRSDNVDSYESGAGRDVASSVDVTAESL